MMSTNVNIDQIKAVADLIREMLGDDFDDQTFLDTLDGETDAMDMVGSLIKARVEAQSVEAAMKDVAKLYTTRAKRYAAQAAACSEGIGRLLDAMGQRKISHDLGTVSRTKPRTSLSIEDPADIPSQLCKLVPDNAAVKASLEAGENVPGASLKVGDPGVMVRVA